MRFNPKQHLPILSLYARISIKAWNVIVLSDFFSFLLSILIETSVSPVNLERNVQMKISFFGQFIFVKTFSWGLPWLVVRINHGWYTIEFKKVTNRCSRIWFLCNCAIVTAMHQRSARGDVLSFEIITQNSVIIKLVWAKMEYYPL